MSAPLLNPNNIVPLRHPGLAGPAERPNMRRQKTRYAFQARSSMKQLAKENEDDFGVSFQVST